MAYNAGPPQGGPPFQQYPSQQNPPYPSQQNPPYPSQQNPPYPSQQNPPYPSQAAPQYPSQAAPQYPSQAAPQYPSQATPPYLDPSASSAPPQIDGYRDIGFDGGFVRPPADPMPSAPPADQPRIAFTQDPLTRDEVKDALSAFVAQHCCYGSGPIKDMQIRNVAPTFTFKYTLESFVEKRETKWKFEPFSGNGLPAGGGPAPQPWEIPLTPGALFKDEKKVLQVPNTQTLRPCHDCQAHGDVRCKHCAGRGQDRCGQCGGSGQRLGDVCSRCGGVGTNKCTWCVGNGMVTCTTCKGKRNLKYFVEMTVTWKVHADRYVVETPAGLPDSEVTAVSGETVCQAKAHLVWPLTGFPDSRIVTASEHLVRKHHTGWPMGRILQQRHDVQQIAIHSVSYNYGGNEGTFFVCGHERNVHFPDYPSQCCGCCAVM
ncbi:protein SSUH2 homolog [Amphibalanus amphitrite]|uniref:protein SSUH2 homolog n=1 Tax=Amphibalanus amphitrite TaxID=1232801 RepID=UPI001C90F803|nr:protein SSUH2 homolog [Amphibalanus amphitrite]XP_043227066.1 protein SSUH2 homolog [Amphibalanus amphitrite]